MCKEDLWDSKRGASEAAVWGKNPKKVKWREESRDEQLMHTRRYWGKGCLWMIKRDCDAAVQECWSAREAKTREFG